MTTAAEAKRATDKAELLLITAELAKTDPWLFLQNFVYTHDESDKSVPAKLFPGHKLMYRIITRGIMDHNILFIEKSRQIMVSWIIVALALHDAMFGFNRRICFQSTKDETAQAIVKRARFIYTQLHKRGFPGLPEPNWSKGRAGTDSELYFQAINSTIQAAPQGGEVFASFTFSWVFADELSKQTEAEDGYTCAIPTVKGDSKYLAPGTPHGKTFHYRKLHGRDKMDKYIGEKLVDSYDVTIKRYSEQQLIDMPSDEFNAIPFETLCACCPGIHYWVMRADEETTPCMSIHYSADPDCRPGTVEGDAWFKRERSKVDQAKWDREREIKYNTPEGRPVISNWKNNIFISDQIKVNPREMVHIGVDFGKIACALFAQKHHIEDYNFYQARMFAECVLRGTNTYMLSKAIVEILQRFFPDQWRLGNFLLYPDPTGHKTSTTTSNDSLNTDISILEAHGLRVSTRKFGIKESATWVETLFSMTSPDGDPGVLVHPRCDYHISCFDGGWHYPDKPIGLDDGKPEKDGEYDHGGDDTRYLLSNMFEVKDIMDEKKDEGMVIVPIFRKGSGMVCGHKMKGRRYASRGRH